MSRSIGQDLHDHVRWLDTFTQTMHFDLDRDGSVSISRVKALKQMVDSTLKLARKVNAWETL